MKCIIVDDEPLAIKWLEKLIIEIDSVEVVSTFSNAIQANEFIQNNAVDLMFLDIEMASLNGLDFMKSLIRCPLVIFVTAYPQYAIESYQLHAFDYLLKPVRMETLMKSVNRAKDHLKLLQQADGQRKATGVESRHIFVRADKRFVKILFTNILYIEGLKDYVVINTIGKKVITAMNLKTIYEQLPKEIFARISKSHIVNTNHITSTDFNTVFISEDGIPIGNAYREPFYKTFVNHSVLKR